MGTATAEHPYTVIWLTQAQARVFIKSPGKHHRTVIESGHRGNPARRGPVRHTTDNSSYFDAIVLSLPATGDILIVGPDGVKTELRKYLQSAALPVAERICAVQNASSSSEGQVLAQARAFFLNDPVPGIGAT